ncbi:autoinducer binding domain-containing protein, partial [Pseudomonas aeruginosa]
VDPAIINGQRSSKREDWSENLFDESRMNQKEARQRGVCVGETMPLGGTNNLLSVLYVARDQQHISRSDREKMHLPLLCM